MPTRAPPVDHRRLSGVILEGYSVGVVLGFFVSRPPPRPPLNDKSARAGKYPRHYGALPLGLRPERVSARPTAVHQPHHSCASLPFREAGPVSAVACLQGKTGKSGSELLVSPAPHNGQKPGTPGFWRCDQEQNPAQITGKIIQPNREPIYRIRELNRRHQAQAANIARWSFQSRGRPRCMMA